MDSSAILASLPYLGLDIEDQRGDLLTVEYSPNRPDFSSEVGIARSLLGFLGLELGLPRYEFGRSQFSIRVEKDEIQTIRPFVFGICARVKVTEELLRQIIIMQEDLHNGLGRNRSKVAIGFHNANVIETPIKYFSTRDSKYSFVPLGASKSSTIREILEKTEQGRSYGKILMEGVFPMLTDSNNQVLSMPPIINGELTRLTPGNTGLFVDVTSTDRQVGDVATAIIAAMLADNGAKIETVNIRNEAGSFDSPDMTPTTTKFDLELVNEVLGLQLSDESANNALRKSRLELFNQNEAMVPRYRNDIIHPVDLAEEIALGIGIMNLAPEEVSSSLSGSFHPRLRKIDSMIEALVGLGLTEISGFSLAGEKEVLFSTQKEEVLKLDEPKSLNYQYLKSELLPSLLFVLGSSTHEEYPQTVFEQSAVLKLFGASELQVLEEEHVAVALAGSTANFTLAKSFLEGFVKAALGGSGHISFEPKGSDASVFASGRSANIFQKTMHEGNKFVGTVGEISPSALEKSGLKVPVSAFELNIEPWLEPIPF